MTTTRKTIKVNNVLEAGGNVFADLSLRLPHKADQARLTLQIA